MTRPSDDSSTLSLNAGAFVVVHGFLVTIGRQSTINSPRSGIYQIKWKNDTLPEGAKIGTRITIFGELVTLNLGKGFFINRAVLLKQDAMRRLKKSIRSEK